MQNFIYCTTDSVSSLMFTADSKKTLQSVHHVLSLSSNVHVVVVVVVVVVDPTPPTCCQQSPAPESCGSQQSLLPGGKERLHFVGIRPEVQARKGGW